MHVGTLDERVAADEHRRGAIVLQHHGGAGERGQLRGQQRAGIQQVVGGAARGLHLSHLIVDLGDLAGERVDLLHRALQLRAHLSELG